MEALRGRNGQAKRRIVEFARAFILKIGDAELILR
jgi:hypothetical protein